MKPVIFGCAGPSLSDAEREFFAREQPAGFILFARNVQSPQQLKALTTDLRLSVDRQDLLILIDQEGGRVQRMKPPHWRSFVPMATFGDGADQNPSLAAEALALHCRILADDLRRAGITGNCVPVLDVPAKDADDIIGDRAFGTDAELVARLGRIAVDATMKAGVLPVMKHIPGHGRATVDSHEALPRVSASLAELRSVDFAPFKALADCPLAMTAHIVFEEIDADLPATLSQKVISSVIRGDIGFDGFLMTDDLSMKALEGPVGERAARALDAGCDLVLHCNGEFDEMVQIAQSVEPMSADTVNRLLAFVSEMQNAPIPDRAALEADYEAAMAQVTELV